MVEKVRLRPQIDLASRNGHHIPGTPYTYRHGWHAISPTAAVPKTLGESRLRLVDEKGAPTRSKAVVRHYRQVSSETRMSWYKDSGLELHYAHSTTEELLSMWADPKTPRTEKVRIREDIEKRQKVLAIAAEAINRDLTDAARESHRDIFRRFDDKLRKHKFGRSVIELRERILKDKTLDKLEVFTDKLHENGKEWAIHTATGLAIGFILEPLVLHAVSALGGESGQVLAEHLMGNIYAESMIAVTMAKPLAKLIGPIFRPLERESRVKRAEKKMLHRHEIKHEEKVVANKVQARFVEGPKAALATRERVSKATAAERRAARARREAAIVALRKAKA